MGDSDEMKLIKKHSQVKFTQKIELLSPQQEIVWNYNVHTIVLLNWQVNILLEKKTVSCGSCFVADWQPKNIKL